MSHPIMKSPLLVAAVLLAAVVALVVQTTRLRAAARAQAALGARIEAAEREAAAAKSELAKAIRAAENDPRNAELARLRAELAALRRQHTQAVAEAARLQQSLRGSAATVGAAADGEEAPDPARAAFKTVGIAKLNYAKHWGLAFHLFAQEHGDRMPATLDEAAAFFSRQAGGAPPATVLDPASHSYVVTTEVDGVPSTTAIRPDQYEILYGGRLTDVANPAMTIGHWGHPAARLRPRAHP